MAVQTRQFQPIEDGFPPYSTVIARSARNTALELPRSSFFVISSPLNLFATITRVRWIGDSGTLSTHTLSFSVTLSAGEVTRTPLRDTRPF